MKRFLCLLMTLLITLLFTIALAESVTQKTITIDFGTFQRVGEYTGSINENNQPHGYGVFSAVDEPYGTQCYYIGDWVNGKYNGNGMEVWADGLIVIGTYSNMERLDTKIYIAGSDIVDYYIKSESSSEYGIRCKKYRINDDYEEILYFDGYVNAETGAFTHGTLYDSDGKLIFTGDFGEGGWQSIFIN